MDKGKDRSFCLLQDSVDSSDRHQSSKGSFLSEKNPLMYIMVLSVWFIWLMWFNPRLFALFPQNGDLWPTMVVLSFVLCLNIYWLFGSYYLMLAIFTLIVRLIQKPAIPPLKEYPPVAILYTTMHDFQEEAALSCINQDYPNSHLFILDDSVDEEFMDLVDVFALQQQGFVTVVRRTTREGFKAGSINQALRNHVKEFPYFAVADADSVLPSSFLRKLMPYFGIDINIGFIQASHRPHPQQKTHFARDLSLGIIPLWTIYYGPRNQFGNVIFLGHGGIIRYDVWEKVGEIPELVSEDLAFSTRAAQLGYKGYFVHDVASYEDFPSGYRQLRRQHEKYVKGVCEYFHKEFWSFICCPGILWFEKLDVLLSCLSLLMPSLSLLFLLTYSVFMPFLFSHWKLMTLVAAGHELGHFNVLLFDESFGNLWTWDFYLVTLLCTFAPMFGSLALMLQHPVKALKMLLLSFVPYMSHMLICTAAIISYCLSGKAVFLVTGDRWGAHSKGEPGYPHRLSFIERIGSEDWITRSAELALGLVLMVMCIVTLNLMQFAFALSLFLGPLLFRVPWNSKLLRPALYAPIILIFLGLGLAGSNILLGQGIFMSVFSFHF